MGFLDPKALRDWIKSRAVNNLMATAKGFFLDARVGPVIQEKIDEVKEEVDEINGNLQHKASLNSENTFTKTITSTNDKDLSSTSFMDGQFSSWAPFHLNPNARAGYGFHNQGNNACFLYLDLDGTLKCIDTGGGIRQIQTTRIN